jgi:hypothetical protein
MTDCARFCVICGHKLHVDGVRLLCDRHGEMRPYLAQDPLAAAVVEVCDAVGIVNIEEA